MSLGHGRVMGSNEITPDPVMLVYRIARGALIAGFLITLALVAVTLVLAVATGDPVAESTMDISDLPAAVRDGDPSAVAQLAIFAIVLTPVLTTLAVIVGFLRIGDRRFAGISALVLVVLSASMVVALLR
jgi:uncharacterized membrane protein